MNLKLLKRILAYSKGHKKYFVISIISSILFVALSLYIPILTGKAVDHVISVGNVDMDYVLMIVIEIASITGFLSLIQWVMGIASQALSYEIVKEIRSAAFKKMEVIPISTIDSNKEGDLLSRMINDVEMISTGLIQGFQQLFSGVATIVLTLAFMLYLNIAIALIVVLVTPLSLFIASFIAKGCHKLFKAQSKINGEILGLSEEIFGNTDIVGAFNYEEYSYKQMNKLNDSLLHVGTKAQFFSAMTNPCTRFVNGIVYAAVGVIGAYVCIKNGFVIGGVTLIGGGITVGELTSFLSYANQYTKPFNEISGVVTELQSAFASAQRVFEIIDQKEVINEGTITDSLDGKIKFDDVSFSYVKEKKLIEHFSLEVEPGKMIAIVGPTGAGKSTMINLLMRFYEVDLGDILLSGKSIKDYDREAFRIQMGMVLQDTWLFQGTIFDNIAYGKKNATLEEVIDSAKKANADSFIRRLPNGYETVLMGQSSLSEGEKQLLCIARVMLMNPAILILDEATSSIDTRTEMKVQQAFDTLLKGKTSFVIAHRLQTIINADKILVMNKGSILEQGSHQELMKKKGFYFDLFNRQF